MNGKIKEAIAELEKLPAAEQEFAAEAVLDFAHRAGRIEFTEEQAEKRCAGDWPIPIRNS